MRIVIFTSNSIRHKFFANSISKRVEESLIVSECSQNDSIELEESKIINHFKKRFETEQKYFGNNDYFLGNVIPIMYKEVNMDYIYKIIMKFQPDCMIVFGSSIIKEPLLSIKTKGFINLHLGISPYYRGSGTNFWPFVNDELQYVGSTILYLDPGIDSGDIITHVRPKFEIDDDVHTVGCKVIKESVKTILKIIEKIRNDEPIKSVKQWKVRNERYYKNKDFDLSALEKYQKNLENGIIKKYMINEKDEIKLIYLD